MSMILAAKAWKIKLGNPIRKMILIKLADNANDNGECWPSYQHIADQCETSRRTVINHINELEKMGLIKKIARKTNRGNSSNKFILTLPSENYSPVKNKGNSLETPSAGDSPHGEKYSLDPSERDSSGSEAASPPSAGDSPTPSAGDSPRISHSLNQSMNHKKTNKKNDASTSDTFDDFWDAYPKTARRVAKAKCLDVWKRHKLDDIAHDIIEHVKGMSETEQWRTGYEPAPLTYLNQKRWQDGIPDEKPKGSKTACGLPRHFGDIDYAAGLTQNEDGSYAF